MTTEKNPPPASAPNAQPAPRPPSKASLLRAQRRAARIAESSKPAGRKSQEVDHILRSDPIPWRPTTK